jgi:hypothetical protein
VHSFFIISVNSIIILFSIISVNDFLKLSKHIGCGAGERVCPCADDALAGKK